MMIIRVQRKGSGLRSQDRIQGGRRLNIGDELIEPLSKRFVGLTYRLDGAAAIR